MHIYIYTHKYIQATDINFEPSKMKRPQATGQARPMITGAVDGAMGLNPPGNRVCCWDSNIHAETRRSDRFPTLGMTIVPAFACFVFLRPSSDWSSLMLI